MWSSVQTRAMWLDETPNRAAATPSIGSDQTISYSTSRLTGPSSVSSGGADTCVVSFSSVTMLDQPHLSARQSS